VLDEVVEVVQQVAPVAADPGKQSNRPATTTHTASAGASIMRWLVKDNMPPA
jgi:hypothetical protein